MQEWYLRGWLTTKQIEEEEHVPATTLSRWRKNELVPFKVINRWTGEEVTERWQKGETVNANINFIYNRQRVHEFNLSRDVPRNWINIDGAVKLTQSLIDGGLTKKEIMELWRDGKLQGQTSYTRGGDLFFNPISIRNHVENSEHACIKGSSGEIDCSKAYRPIPGFDFLYGCSEDGTIVNFDSKKTLRPIKNGESTHDKHLKVALMLHGLPVPFPVHQIVIQLFVNNPYNYRDGHHINGNPQDNRASNLLPCDNTTHGRLHGLYMNKMMKLKKTDEEYKRLNKEYKKEVTEIRRKNNEYVAVPTGEPYQTMSHVYLVKKRNAGKLKDAIKKQTSFNADLIALEWFSNPNRKSLFDYEQEEDPVPRVKKNKRTR